MNILAIIKDKFKLCPDLKVKKIKISLFKYIDIVYLDTLCSLDKMNAYVLDTLILRKNKINKYNLSSYLASANNLKIKLEDIEFYLTNGYCLVIMSDCIIAVEVKKDINRSISTSSVESSINGPKDAFIENIEVNEGLIKKRLRTSNLKTIKKYVGKQSNTLVDIIYLENIADEKLVNDIDKRIEDIDIDAIIDSSSLGLFLEEENNVYPSFNHSERPDTAVVNLLQGKVIVMVENCPNVLIIPSFFIDFLNPSIDNYNKGINVSFIKILRICAFLISMITPAIYIALMNYNQETIPTSLLLNFIKERQGVPFPTIIEVAIMLLVCEILRESDLRFPSNYGSAISILGAIVLGEASVSAHIASPITIIVVAITFISSLAFVNIEINNALRYFRFIFIIFSSILGLYGITLAFLYFLIYTSSKEVFAKPYMFPFSPFDKSYFFDSILKSSIKKDKFRSKMLTHNLRKQGNK